MQYISLFYILFLPSLVLATPGKLFDGIGKSLPIPFSNSKERPSRQDCDPMGPLREHCPATSCPASSRTSECEKKAVELHNLYGNFNEITKGRDPTLEEASIFSSNVIRILLAFSDHNIMAFIYYRDEPRLAYKALYAMIFHTVYPVDESVKNFLRNECLLSTSDLAELEKARRLIEGNPIPVSTLACVYGGSAFCRSNYPFSIALNRFFKML